MKIRPFTSATPVTTPSDAGRALGAIAKKNDAQRKAATLDRLKACVATGRISHLGWKA